MARVMTQEHKDKMAAARLARKAAIESGEMEATIRKNPIEKLKENPTSRVLAIVAKCYECAYDPTAGGSWRQQVEACSCVECPLHTVRPMTTNKED